MPPSLVEQELPHLGQVLGLEIEAPSPAVDALRALVPMWLLDAEGVEEARLQVVDDLLPRHLLDDGREHVRAHAVVAVARAGLIVHGPGEESLHPVCPLPVARGGGRLGVVAAGHRQQVAHRHLPEVLRRVGRSLVGEEGDHLVVHRQEPFAYRQPHGGRGERLADAVQHVRLAGRTLAEPFLVEHLAVLEHHDAVDVHLPPLHGLHVRLHGVPQPLRGLLALQGEAFPLCLYCGRCRRRGVRPVLSIAACRPDEAGQQHGQCLLLHNLHVDIC